MHRCEYTPFVDRRETYILCALVLTALGIRGLLVWLTQPYLIESTWDFGYEAGRIAASIASGEGFASPLRQPSGPTAWLMPGYPALLAAVFAVFGVYSATSAIVSILLNCLLSSLTVAPLYLAGRALFGRTTGYFAAAVFLVYPASLWHATNTIWDTTLFTLLITITMAWIYYLSDRLPLKQVICFGLFLGMTALVNAVACIWYPCIVLWLLYRSRDRRHDAAMLMVMTACCCALLLPWAIRNHHALGKPTLRSNLGLELKLGNNIRLWEKLHAPNDSGLAVYWREGHPAEDVVEFGKYKRLGEIEYNAICLEDATAFMVDHPEKFIGLTLKRFERFWLGAWEGSNDWSGNLKIADSLSGSKVLFHVLPLPFMLLGMWLAVVNRAPAAPIFALLILMPLIYYVTHVSQRYRNPVEPAILLFACFSVTCLARRIPLLRAIAGAERP